MGYTHYWKYDSFTDLQWSVLIQKTKEILQKAKEIKICGFTGDGEPTINDKTIALNGSSSLSEDHESFVLMKDGTEFNFCKTAHKPYDKVVTAILYEAQQINSSFEPTSDGGMEAIRNDFK